MTRGMDGAVNQIEEFEGMIDIDQAIALKTGSMSNLAMSRQLGMSRSI
jgi:hypothetical protein